jgi:hypothetical protein
MIRAIGTDWKEFLLSAWDLGRLSEDVLLHMYLERARHDWFSRSEQEAAKYRSNLGIPTSDRSTIEEAEVCVDVASPIHHGTRGVWRTNARILPIDCKVMQRAAWTLVAAESPVGGRRLLILDPDSVNFCLGEFVPSERTTENQQLL